MAEENKTAAQQNENKDVTKIINLEELGKMQDEVKKYFDEKTDELKENIEKQIEALKESHSNVTDTTKNKYGAYFFRVVELAVLACLIYSILNRVF